MAKITPTHRCRRTMHVLAFGLFVAAAIFGAAAAAMPAAHFEVRAGTLIKNQPPRPPDAPQGVDWWHYQVTLRETSGRAGITLTGWTKCYITKDDAGCKNIRTNFMDLYGTTRVAAGGTVRLIRPAWVWAGKTGDTYKVEANYWGIDDNGHKVESGYKFNITSD